LRPDDRMADAQTARVGIEHQLGLSRIDPTQDDRQLSRLSQQLIDDGGALEGCLARRIDRLRHTLTEGPMMVDPRETEVAVGKTAEGGYRLIGTHGARLHVIEEGTQRGLIHLPSPYLCPGRGGRAAA
jgi:hypothetical protein